MLEYNIRTVESEIGKIAFSKMETVQQAEKLGLLYEAKQCLIDLLSKDKSKQRLSRTKAKFPRTRPLQTN